MPEGGVDPQTRAARLRLLLASTLVIASLYVNVERHHSRVLS